MQIVKERDKRPAVARSRLRRWLLYRARLACLALLAGSALAACAEASGIGGTPTVSGVPHPSALHFVFGGQYATNSTTTIHSTLVALDAHTGRIAWTHPLETPNADDGTTTYYPAVTANGLAYLGYSYTPPSTALPFSVLEAIDPTTGRTRWRQELDAGHSTEFAGPPVVAGSTVYVSATVFQGSGLQGTVAAFDTQSGDPHWRTALADPPTMPAVASGNVLVMTNPAQGVGGDLLALRVSDGSTAWDYGSGRGLSRGDDLENGWYTAPVVSGDLAFPLSNYPNADGSADMVQLAIDMRDGSLAWQYDTGGTAATPALDQGGDELCLGISSATRSTDTGRVVALAATTGKQRWSVGLSAFVSACVASGATFLVNAGTTAGASGEILALRSQDGQRAWQAITGAPVDADGALAPVASNGLVVDYLPANNGSTGSQPVVVVLRATDGGVVWHQGFDGHPDFGADVEGDVLFNPEQKGFKGDLVAYALGSGVRLWSYPPGDG